MSANRIRIAMGMLSLGLALSVRGGEESSSPDRVTFKAGKVLVPKGGKQIESVADVTFVGEIVIKTNGLFSVQKGKARQMREGQTIDAQGMLSSPDGSVVPVFDHVVLRGGRVQVVKDGESKALAGELALPDGTKVLADGSLRGRGGSMRRLLDGQLLKLDGSSVAVTDTISLNGGKVVLFKDGGRVELKRGQVIAMSDGTRVSGDGIVTRPGGARTVLKEGETIKIPGVLSPKR